MTNLPPDGGYKKFQSERLTKQTFAVALQDSPAISTSMLGKYLNGYGDPKMNATTAPVPPGWTDWHVSNNTGYGEFNYYMNDNGSYNFYLKGLGTYGVDVLNADAPAVHRRDTPTNPSWSRPPPSPRIAVHTGTAQCQRLPRDDRATRSVVQRPEHQSPTWLGQRAPDRDHQILTIDAAYRKRAQAIESVDKLLADTEATLNREGTAQNTYIVFSSDNGYHLGQHRILDGKQTAFDTDIRVPLIVAGPGVPHGKVVAQVAQNTDLCPTFEQLAGLRVPSSVEGHSLVPLLHPSRAAPRWRTVALLEHQGDTKPGDPDFQGAGSNPPSYIGIRIQGARLPGFRGPLNATWVEYRDHQHDFEYYNDAKDPYQLDNIASSLTKRQRTTLHAVLERLHTCHTSSTCWKAGVLQ